MRELSDYEAREAADLQVVGGRRESCVEVVRGESRELSNDEVQEATVIDGPSGARCAWPVCGAAAVAWAPKSMLLAPLSPPLSTCQDFCQLEHSAMMAQCAEQLSQLSAERRRNDGLDAELRQAQEQVATLQAERDAFQGEVGGYGGGWVSANWKVYRSCGRCRLTWLHCRLSAVLSRERWVGVEEGHVGCGKGGADLQQVCPCQVSAPGGVIYICLSLPPLPHWLRDAPHFALPLLPHWFCQPPSPPLQVYHAKERAVDLQAELSHVQAVLAVAQAAEAGALQAAAVAAGAQVRKKRGGDPGSAGRAEAAGAL